MPLPSHPDLWSFQPPASAEVGRSSGVMPCAQLDEDFFSIAYSYLLPGVVDF